MKGGKSKADAKRGDSREDFRKQYKEEHPNNKSVAVVGKAGGDKWKSLSDEGESLPSITMNNIKAFIRNNKSPCRVFWCYMYTICFMVGWVSFYYKRICDDYMSLMERGNKLKMSMHVVLGLGVYGLVIFLVLPLVYLLHQAIKETVENAKRVLGTRQVVAIYKCLLTITFPMVCVCMSCFLDTPSLWTFMGIVGSMHCLYMCYVNPDDYGISDGFSGLLMAVALNLKDNKMGGILFGTIVFVSLRTCDDDNAQESQKEETLLEDNFKIIQTSKTLSD